MEEKYGQGGLRKKTKKVKQRNGRVKEVTIWRGYLKYRVPNPKFIEPPTDGPDNRTQTQRRRTAWQEITEAFDPATVRTEKQARDELARWKARMEEEAQRESMPGVNTSVGEYVDSYIDDLEASKSIERRTVRDYRGIARRIRTGFEGVALCDLTPTMVQKWENGLIASGLAPSTVIKYHRVLSEACKHAVNVDVLVKNPCQAVRPPKRQAPSPNSLTAEGYARLAATLDNMEPTPLVTAAAIAMHTGMRQGEVCGLRWRCYDSEKRTIRVEEAIGVANGGTYSKAPKTKSSQRIVPVSPQLASILERRRASMLAELQEGGLVYSDEEFGKLYVVGFVDGRYRDPLRICKEWKSLSAAFGLSGTQGRAISFHDLRHSFATRAIAAGADVKAVAAVLGHSNAAITLNVYADADPQSKRRASDLISQAIAAQGEVEPFAELAN